MKVWIVLEEDKGYGTWAEVFSSKEKAEAAYNGSSNIEIYETEIDALYNKLDPKKKG
jgi:hypothetical protein